MKYPLRYFESLQVIKRIPVHLGFLPRSLTYGSED